ncbi:PINIT domain-containing protein [Diplogelasinospora grovesii]|uniref:PINIT domain-containing protein n=1 Tax=Diplogelasinospora grovesii TaxID=303347 RepID=A0AAN6NFS2_9PEZI|nr:PINIT domain-containing protein [Diplogelasinospora grovesii]
MASTGPSAEDVRNLNRIICTPAVQKAILQGICSVNGVSKTGTKTELQQRLMARIRDVAANRDLQRFNEIYESVRSRIPAHIFDPSLMTAVRTSMGRAPQPPVLPPPPQASYYSASSTQPAYLHPLQLHQSPAVYPATNGLRPQNTTTLPQSTPDRGVARARFDPGSMSPAVVYKPSPFYDIRYAICERTCEVMAQHRNSVNVSIRAQDHTLLQQWNLESDLRVMVFCAAGNTGTQDIAFPHQSELKVNGGDVKANLRGLKNKPGSTRPVDITDALRLKPPTYVNNIEFTYALTQKKYYMGVFVCKTTPVETLVEQIRKGKKIQKKTVLQEMTKKANDPDVIAMAQNLSLKCPLTYMRLNLPCRGIGCSHNQCFDATSYLQLQEQGPQWVCPICNKGVPFDQLAVDEYVGEILAATSESTEQVTIEPDGQWSVPGAQKEVKAEPRQTASLVDDDDWYQVETFQNGSHGPETPRKIAAYIGTPSNGADSRENSTIPRSSSGNKRPAPEVIDLTLSDDDDEPRPVKRPNYGRGGFSDGGF